MRDAVMPVCLCCFLTLLPLTATAQESPASPADFNTAVASFTSKFCLDCHGPDEPMADLNLTAHWAPARSFEDREVWEKVVKLLTHQEMPPDGELQPSPQERESALALIKAELSRFDCQGQRRPGRVTLRRLNRVEYDNTIRDLLGIALQPARDFPSDDVGAGFDNIGDVLSMPPLLVEKFIAAAQEVVAKAWDDAEARQRILVCDPAQVADEEKEECYRRILTEFARRAFRRPPRSAEIDRLLQLGMSAFQKGASPEQALQLTLTAVLASPHFLFRVEADPPADDPQAVRDLDGYELASRLSYFLWSSMPDERLFGLAEAGQLADPQVLRQEAQRMLHDPKARALVDNFAGQWLQLRDLNKLFPDPDLFPEFDGSLRQAMLGETQMFFAEMIREDRSVLDFLDADYTYVNERLARHYGIPDVHGDQFRRVATPPSRRGVLTHGSILLLTSNPTRTSPVKRGKWILENFLDDPPPPPLPGVQALENQPELLGSLRERMEQHRSDPNCAVCHRRMDVLGFGLEHFDAVGAWRERDGSFEIVAGGKLPGGVEFERADQLMQLLRQSMADEFCRCLTRKMLTYALGRQLQAYDRCAVDEILAQMREADYRFSSLVLAIATCEPFVRRGNQ